MLCGCGLGSKPSREGRQVPIAGYQHRRDTARCGQVPRTFPVTRISRMRRYHYDSRFCIGSVAKNLVDILHKMV